MGNVVLNKYLPEKALKILYEILRLSCMLGCIQSGDRKQLLKVTVINKQQQLAPLLKNIYLAHHYVDVNFINDLKVILEALSTDDKLWSFFVSFFLYFFVTLQKLHCHRISTLKSIIIISENIKKFWPPGCLNRQNQNSQSIYFKTRPRLPL